MLWSSTRYTCDPVSVGKGWPGGSRGEEAELSLGLDNSSEDQKGQVWRKYSIRKGMEVGSDLECGACRGVYEETWVTRTKGS